MKPLPVRARPLSLSPLLRPALGGALLLAAAAGLAAGGPGALLPAGAPGRLAPGPRADAATKVDFTFSGAGHPGEQVHLRDADADVPAPYACFYHDGVVFGIQGPIVELRTSKLGPKLWTLHLLLKGTPGAGGLPVDSSQPALVFNGDNSPRQQAFFPVLNLPPLRQGTLSARFLPGPKGRLRGTFAGTLVTDKGEFVTISNGSFDLPRRPDGD